MKKRRNLIAIIGVILIFISLATFFLSPKSSSLAWLILISGIIALAVFIFYQVEKIKYFLTTRSFKYTSNIIMMSIAVFGIVILINFIFHKHNYRIDTTRNKLFTLSPQSQKIVSSLTDRVFVKGFFKPADAAPIKELLSEYQYYSDRFKFEIIDPDANPALVKRYNIKSYGTLVFEFKNKIEKITDDTEKAITNALIKVTRDEVKKIYFSTMHGERSIDDINPEGYNEAKKGIEEDNYQIEEILLAENENIPDDCTVLVIVSPQTDFLETEYDVIQQYLNRGGKLFLLVDPDQPGLEKLVEPWGIKVDNNTLIDTSPIGQLAGVGYGSPLITNYEETEITEDFNLMTVFRLARSVRPKAETDSGLVVKALAYTSDFPASWGETNLNQEEIQFDENIDLKGPLPVGVISEKEVSIETESSVDVFTPLKTRIVVIGDSDFASNAFFHFQGNGDLFLNCISWLAEQGDIIAIREKEPENNRLSITVQQSRIIFWVGVIFLPLVIFIFGIITYFQRR